MKIKRRIIFLMALFTGLIFFTISCGVVEYEKKKCPEDKFVRELWLIDLNQNTETFVANGHDPVFSVDSRRIIFVDTSNSVVSFDLQSRKMALLISPHKNASHLAIAYRTSWLAFSAFDFGSASGDIFIFHPDGSGFRNLTYSSSQSESDPSFSSDGQWIVFKENSDIAMINFQGEKRILLKVSTGSVGSPQLTLTGNQLAFLHYPDRNVRIHNLNHSSKDTTIQIASENFDVSPIKDEILYFYYGGLYLLDTHSYAKEKIADYGRVFSFSPDGKSVVFLNLNNELIRETIETKAQHVIKKFDNDAFDSGNIHMIRLSPDNQKIVFQKNTMKKVIPQ